MVLLLSAQSVSAALFLVGILVVVPVAVVLTMRRRKRIDAPLDWRDHATARALAEGNAQEILDGAFDGSPTVTYDTRPPDSVSAKTAMAGAVERGYTFVREDEGVLVFRLRSE